MAENSEWKQTLKQLKGINPLVVLLIMCFAFSSWIDLMGVWVEFPILVHVLPEGWNLPSYVVVLVQCAVITPIIYSMVNKICPGNIKHREIFMAYFIMAVGMVSLLLLAAFWRHTVYFAGAERSLAVLCLVFLLSMVDTTSCIVYLPFMSRFKEVYIPPYVAGEEAGGLITGFAGMIQGVGGELLCTNMTRITFNETLGVNVTETFVTMAQKEPRFSVSAFFIFLMFLIGLSMVSFTLLNYAPFARREMVHQDAAEIDSNCNEKKPNEESNGIPLLVSETDDQDTMTQKPDPEVLKEETPEPKMARGKLFLFCFLLTFGAIVIVGIFGSLQSFSTLPYGSLTYTLAIRLTCIVCPLSALSVMFVHVKTAWKIAAMVTFTILLSIFHLIMALKSPNPPLKGTAIGSVIMVVTTILLMATFSFARSNMVMIMRREGGHQALFLGGVSIQIGAVIGGISGFLMVNVFQIFESEVYHCN